MFPRRLAYRGRDGDPTDEQLAQRLQQGDATALTSLFDRYHDPLYRFLLRWSGSVEEAEDLVQETFLRVYLSIPSYTPERPFRPWLYTIARHLAWKKLRQKRGEMWVSLDESPEIGEVIPDAGEGPQGALDRHSDGETIRMAVDGLPEEQRIVFILHHYNGLPYEEISEICGCPIGTVKSRMHYALAQLRRRLAYLKE